MAEIAVNVVVVDKLVPLLSQESHLLKGVRKVMDSIKGELESIRSFLRDADVKAETDGSVKAWVKQVREVAYRTEDVIDEYVLHRSKQAFCQTCGCGRLLINNFVREVASPCLTKKLIWSREISDEIKDIKKTLCEIKARRDRYNFNSSSSSSSEQGSSSNSGVPWHYPGLASLFIGARTEIVGFELQRPLSQQEAWELFCKTAFKFDFHGRCPQELKEFSLEIVRKCQGLPLAIVLIGGVLSRRDKVASQWRMLHDGLRSELENNPELPSITKIISLCYYDLPYYLKSCFLYFGIFPENYSVRRGRLIRLWAAEGFVKEAADKTVQEVAEDYLNELIHRSFVEVSEVFFDGRARSCQIHVLVRDFILQKHNELNFCLVLPEQKDPSFGGSIRRLSICNSKVNVPKITNLPKLRSVCMFGENELPKRFPNTVTKTFKLLKILDFQDAPITSVPDEVGNLFHLRYLSVRDTKVSMLPKSIGKLQNLLTLELRGPNMNLLPGEILGLPKLRHLLVGSTRRGVKIPEGIGSLETLQNLCYVEAYHGDGLVRNLRKLKQLRKLGILDLKKENGEALCTAIENMRHLRSLFVCSINAFEEILDLQSISSPPPLLQRLYLKGRLEKLPDWISKLQNLTKIRFVMAKLSDDPLNVLQALLNLLELWLEDAYDGEQLHFEATGFQKLKILRLHEFDRVTRLKWVMIDEGALPLLQELKIHHHIQLKEGCPGMLRQRNVRIW